MRDLVRPILLIVVVLAIPIVPFLAFGPPMQARIEAWCDRTLPPTTIAVTVIGLLASDVFLPIPSSVLSTFAGDALGMAAGTAVSWAGMTAGAIVGFVLARAIGRPLALRLSREDDLARIELLSRRCGPAVLVVARPVPVLAEASVLMLGAAGLSWRRFLAPVALSNLGIAAAYSALGHLVQLPIALAASIALPLAATGIARYALPGSPGTAGGPT